MIEKRGRGQPKFEPTQEQRNQVKLMKALAKPLPNSNAAPKTLVIGRRRTASIPIEHRPNRSALTGDVRGRSQWHAKRPLHVVDQIL